VGKIEEEQILFIGGSRGFASYHLLCRTIELLRKWGILNKGPLHIVSGGAGGADTMAENYAKVNGYKFTKYPADWDRYGKKAGMLRNITMVDVSDIQLLFWDGVSKGTRHAITYATKCNPKTTFTILY